MANQSLRTVGFIFVSLVMVGAARDAAADIITFEARGTLSFVRNADGAFDDTIGVGDEYVLTYSFDTEAERYIDAPTEARYFPIVTAVSFALGGIEFSIPRAELDDFTYIANDQERSPGLFTDVYSVMIYQASSPASLSYNIFFQLANIDQPAISNGVTSTALESTPPDLSGFINRGFRVEAYLGSEYAYQQNWVFGDVQSLNVVPTVPLPAGAWLLLSALGGCTAILRRKGLNAQAA